MTAGVLTLLHVSASPRGSASDSRRVAAEIITQWRARHPGLVVTERDLSARPLPHPDADFVAASLAWKDAPAHPVPPALVTSEVLIDELVRVDAVLISTPMHNFTVPSALKAWIDHVVRPGRTFRSTAQGKRPLLADRPVRVVLSCGGALGAQTAGQEDWASPYLRDVFGVMGLRNFDVLVLENRNSRGATRGEEFSSCAARIRGLSDEASG